MANLFDKFVDFDDSKWIGPVSDYPAFEYSLEQVVRAGEFIARTVPWTDESAPQIRDAFRIANAWRDSHALPMRSLGLTLRHFIRSENLSGFTAGRVKRMEAIRKKLGRRHITYNLSTLQDLGGCRAIMSSVADVAKLSEKLKSHRRHEFQYENNYIAEPKKFGYRSHHIVISFHGDPKYIAFFGRIIEIQIRTKLQHSWATAVEAVGLYLGQNLKGGRGNSDWLRFFDLMSGELSEIEKSPIRLDLSNRLARREEIQELNHKLHILQNLDNLRNVVKWAGDAFTPRDKPTHYILKYNNYLRTVEVKTYTKPTQAAESYDMAEDIYNKTGDYLENIVLVELEKIGDLRRAYPNYFLDVEIFRRIFASILKAGDTDEYSVIQQERAPLPLRQERIDPNWVGRSPFPRPKGA